MTAKEWAEKLSGREYGKELTQQEEMQMKQDGIVAVFGAGIDICNFCGAISDLFYFDDDIRVNIKGRVIYNPSDQLDSSEFKQIQPICHDEGNPYWTYETDIPHETFDIYDSDADNELFCKGIVFELPDYEKPLSNLTNFEKIKAMNTDELAAFLLKVNCAYSEDCMVGIGDCKYPYEDCGCRLCFKEWLESEAK